MAKKKILFIIWSYTYGGGAEVILANLVNHLDFSKYDVDILEYWHSDTQKLATDKHVRILKPVIDSTKDGHIKMWTAKILLEHFPFILRKIYFKEKYDYVVAFNTLIPSFFLPKKGKTISWNHGPIDKLKNKRYQYYLQNRVYKHVKKIVAISEKTYNSIIDLYPYTKDKTSIIYNGFNFSEIDAKIKEPVKIKKTKFTFLFAGRLDNNKNPLFLIDIAEKLKTKGLDFELWLMGKDFLKGLVEEKVATKGLENYVKILDYQKNPYPYFNLCDAVLVSSISEGFPTVLAEGMYLGKPFVSTIVGGSKELANNGKCGFITNNFDEYLQYTEKLLTNKKLYQEMAKNAKEYIKNFTIEKQVLSLEKLLEEMDEEYAKN